MRRRVEVGDDARPLGPLGRLGDRVVTGQHQIGQADRGRDPAWPASGGPVPAGPWRSGPWPGGPSARSRDALSMSVRAVGALALEQRRQLGERVVTVDVGTERLRSARPWRPCPPDPRSCTSRSRTAPSTRPNQPSSSRKRLGPDGQHVGEQRRARPAAGGWPPACRAAPRDPPRAACPAPWRAPRRAGAGARRRRARPWWRSPRPRSARGRACRGSPRPRANSPASNLERRAGWSPHDSPQLFDDGLQRVEPFGTDLDLDPPQLHGPLAVADDDHGVVERDLRRVDAADPQCEGAPAGADLEHLAQPARADDGTQPPPDRTVRARGRPRRPGAGPR